MKYNFPALIKEDLDNPGYMVISFPDLIGIGSECQMGKEEETAKEVLELALSAPHLHLVEPTDINYLKQRYPDYKVILVTVDMKN